jgi:6,7-dimethyl-8-ribityllumazine synthase
VSRDHAPLLPSPQPAPGLPFELRQHLGERSAPPGARFGLISGRFNPELTQPLVTGAVQGLLQSGVRAEQVELAWVPGCYELPVVLREWAASGRFHALIALGTVLQGATVHAQSISTQVSRAMTEVSMAHGLPVIDAVVVAPTPEVAAERCRADASGRGWYAALAAVEMVTLLARLRAGGGS